MTLERFQRHGPFSGCSDGGHLQGGMLKDPVYIQLMVPLGRSPEGLRPWQVSPGPALSRAQEPYHASDRDSLTTKPTLVRFRFIVFLTHFFDAPLPITVLHTAYLPTNRIYIRISYVP